MRKVVRSKKVTRKSSKKSKEEELEFRWVGDAIERNGQLYYQEVTHGHEHFKVGDAVELCSAGKQPSIEDDYKKSWIAEIDALWEDEENELWMECRWYYAINDIVPSSRPSYRKRELFETDHISNNPLGSIYQKVSVLPYDDWCALSESERNSTFFCTSFYSPQTTYIHPLYDTDATSKLKRLHLYSYIYNDITNVLNKKTSHKRTVTTRLQIKRSSENEDSDEDSNALDRAKDHLLLSYVPVHIPCRETERQQIYDYLKYSIEQKGNGSPLYVSGMPGTGKTATVREVIRDLKKQLAFNYLEINGMKITSANSAFSLILHSILHKYLVSSRAVELLNEYFQKPKRKNDKPIVILADELDYLFTRNQQVIYKLFDWPNETNSHLIVIGISNTIDLPERIMSLRNVSRLSMNRVLFKPYSKEQISTIINERLNELNVFSKDAIELCSRKVSAISGDIRRALMIARRGAELASERNMEKVTVALIAEAAKEHAESYKMSLLQHCSMYQILLLISIILHMNAIGVDFVLMKDIYDRMNALVLRYAKKNLLFPELQGVAASLASVGIISIVPPSTKFDTLIKLNIQPDDICFALKDNTIAKAEINLLM